MKHATHCQFCKIPITVEIDDSYAELGDPYKLIRMAACNRCADLRVTRRNLERLMGRQCSALCLLRSSKTKEPTEIRSNLERLTQDYARMIARWNHLDGMAWEPAIVDAILEDPHHWGDIAARMWRMCRKPNQVTERTDL